MRAFLRPALAATALVSLVSFGAFAPSTARADGKVGILVLKEHGVGTAAQAQPYLDKFVAIAAQQNGWSDAKGQYQTTRSSADAFVQAEKPHYGILSLAAFLGVKDKYQLDVLGQVAVAHAGGQQYHLISKTAADLAGCKGKRLATDHGDDVRFLERVVSGGKFALSDFTLVATTRPVQTIKKVVAGDADCALIDDAQFEELAKIEEAKDLKSVWKSERLPPMVVVAFPSAPAAERKAFQASFGRLCEGDGKTACGEVGIQSFKAAGAPDYAAVITAYGK